MSYFKKTNIFKQIFFSRGTIVVIFFLIVFTGFGLYSIIGKSIDASKQRKIAEMEVVELQRKQNDLSQKIEMLKTPEGQSEALKEEYPVVASGEHVVVITDDATPKNQTIDDSQVSPKKSFWDYLKNLFK